MVQTEYHVPKTGGTFTAQFPRQLSEVLVLALVDEETDHFIGNLFGTTCRDVQLHTELPRLQVQGHGALGGDYLISESKLWLPLHRVKHWNQAVFFKIARALVVIGFHQHTMPIA